MCETHDLGAARRVAHNHIDRPGAVVVHGVLDPVAVIATTRATRFIQPSIIIIDLINGVQKVFRIAHLFRVDERYRVGGGEQQSGRQCQCPAGLQALHRDTNQQTQLQCRIHFRPTTTFF